jgi:hypothetical protein
MLGGLPLGRVVVLRWPVPVVPLCEVRAGMSPWLAVVDTAVQPFTVVERITAVGPTMVLVPWLLALQSVPPLVRRRHLRTTLQPRIIIPTTPIRGSEMSFKQFQLGLLVLVLSTSGALAQRAVLQACKPDIARYCSHVPPGGERIKGCMKRHVRELSPPCKEAVFQAWLRR